MQSSKNPRGELVTDSGNTGKLCYARLFYTGQPTEMCEQCTSPAGTYPCNFLQSGLDGRLLAPSAMTRDRKSVCFVPYLLHQV